MGSSLAMAGAGICLTFLVLAGCASKPTAADFMRGHATEVQAQADLKSQLAKDWDRGSKLVASGEKRVRDGEKRVRDAERRVESAERDIKIGQDNIEYGRREIAEGQQLINESETIFTENFPGLKLEH